MTIGRWVGEASIGPPQAWVMRRPARPGKKACRCAAVAAIDVGVDLGAAVEPGARSRSGRRPSRRRCGRRGWCGSSRRRARLSVMHSPPVQPISSSRSGTGSVRTMWEEATVRRPRSGPRRPLAAAPIASTRARRRGRAPPSVRASTPPAASRKRAHRRGLVDLDPGGEQALAQAERQPRRLHGRRARGRRRRRGRPARSSGPATSLGAERCDRLRRAELAAGLERRRPGAVVGRRGRDLQVAGAPEPGVDAPAASQNSPIPCDRARRRRGRPPAPPPSPQRSRMRRQREPHRVAEAAVAPARPVAAAVGLEQDDPRLGLQRLRVPGRPEAGEAAADDEHVGLSSPARTGAGATSPASASQ